MRWNCFLGCPSLIDFYSILPSPSFLRLPRNQWPVIVPSAKPRFPPGTFVFHKFKAKTSRYSKKEFVFTVPCAYAREGFFGAVLAFWPLPVRMRENGLFLGCFGHSQAYARKGLFWTASRDTVRGIFRSSSLPGRSCLHSGRSGVCLAVMSSSVGRSSLRLRRWR